MISSYFSGKKVGKDKFGNVFYESKNLSRYFRRSTRWVIYNGIPEPTKISSEWHSWLHHQKNSLPSKNQQSIMCTKERGLNLTGSKFSYCPLNSYIEDRRNTEKLATYIKWKPNKGIR